MSEHKPTLTNKQREAVLDWMELPSKPQVYEAVARMIQAVKAEAWDVGYEAGYADQRYRNTGKPMPVNPYRKGSGDD